MIIGELTAQSSELLGECRRMLRLLVGDDCDEIRVQVTIGHPETVYCHSASFDRLPDTRLGTGRINSAKDLEILRGPAPAGLLRMTRERWVSG
jgi:hypothetical protein